ncbi:MAG: hypothetical protein KAW01_08045 [Deltaproteobacteria bacterium]|nr:hypothetical protein [Deltaproteobacteria bacterium]
MMLFFLRYSRFLWLFAVLTFFLVGCAVDRAGISTAAPPREAYPQSVKQKGPPPWAPAHGRRARMYSYRYYPSSYVYFEASRGLYFYFSDGRWQSGISLPGGIHIDVGDFVSIELESERPYDRFAEHRQEYPPGKWKKKKHKPFKNK